MNYTLAAADTFAIIIRDCKVKILLKMTITMVVMAITLIIDVKHLSLS